jgi:hypothetical protein
MVSIGEERKAATVAVLRDAFRVATIAIQNFSSQQSLDNMRREVGTALLGLSHALEDESLTQETIDRAKYAVEARLIGLAKK